MEDLNSDLLQFLVLDFDLASIISLCKTNKRFNNIICKNPVFWRNKLYKEYPQTKGKIASDSNFREIYLSLANNIKETYYTFISYNNDDQHPKFWSYIKKTPLTDEDFELGDILYPDFIERGAEDFKFQIVGKYPSGTKIWLVYSDDRDLGLKDAFLSKEESVNRIMYILKMLVGYDFTDKIEYDGKSAEEFYGGTLDEVLERYRNELIKNNYLQVPGFPNMNFIIKDFEIVDYEKMLNELKRLNPNWKKLPKDMINEILKYLR
jgi:hypothetical protein